MTTQPLKNVLLVVEPPGFHMLVSELLKGKYNLHKTFNAAEGLKVLQREKDIELVLIDTRLSEESAVEFLGQVKEIGYENKIITMNTDENLSKEFAQLHVDKHIQVPFAPEDFILSVYDVIALPREFIRDQKEVNKKPNIKGKIKKMFRI